MKAEMLLLCIVAHLVALTPSCVSNSQANSARPLRTAPSSGSFILLEMLHLNVGLTSRAGGFFAFQEQLSEGSHLHSRDELPVSPRPSCLPSEFASYSKGWFPHLHLTVTDCVTTASDRLRRESCRELTGTLGPSFR